MESHSGHIIEKCGYNEMARQADLKRCKAALLSQLENLDKIEKNLDLVAPKINQEIVKKILIDKEKFGKDIEKVRESVMTIRSLSLDGGKFNRSTSVRKMQDQKPDLKIPEPVVEKKSSTNNILTAILKKEHKELPAKLLNVPVSQNVEALVSPRKMQDELHFMDNHTVTFSKSLILQNMLRRFADTTEITKEIESVLSLTVNIKVSKNEAAINELYKRAVFLKADKKFDYALKLCDQLLKIVPGNMLALVNKAQILDKKKKYPEMQECLKVILSSPILDLDDLFAYAEALFMQEEKKQEGLKLIRYAAEKGNQHAQLRLGAIYFAGEGLKTDRKKGCVWFQKSADQGNAQAQFNYGYSLMTDHKNDVDGSKYIKQSADQGYSNAEFRLGKYYETHKNLKDAKKYYERAAAKGHETALSCLDLLEDDDAGDDIDPYGRVSVIGK